MADAPRSASPLGIALAACFADALHPTCSKAAHARKTDQLKRINPLIGDYIAFTQPQRDQGEARHQVDDAGRNPHDESADLLILESRQTCLRRGESRDGIPGGTGKRQQRPQDARVNSSREEVNESLSICRSFSGIEQRPPVEQRRAQKADVLKGVNSAVSGWLL